jgi:hypothetical protein
VALEKEVALDGGMALKRPWSGTRVVAREGTRKRREPAKMVSPGWKHLQPGLSSFPGRQKSAAGVQNSAREPVSRILS